MITAQNLKEAGYAKILIEEKEILSNEEKMYRGTYTKPKKPNFDVYISVYMSGKIQEIIIPYCEGIMMNTQFYLAITLQNESLEEIEVWYGTLIRTLGIRE